MVTALTETRFPDLKLLSKGKVRDVYETSDPDSLLFVATDRISAYDVILNNVHPNFVSYWRLLRERYDRVYRERVKS